jgi:hypothetical protein
VALKRAVNVKVNNNSQFRHVLLGFFKVNAALIK